MKRVALSFLIIVTILHLGCKGLVAGDKGSLSWHLESEEHIFLNTSPTIWSKPTEDKSSRLLYYTRPAPELGHNAMETVSKENGARLYGRIKNGSIWLTVNKSALVKWQLEDSSYVAKIYDFNWNLLSTVKFDSPKVEDLYWFDDGQYGGVDLSTGMFHIVVPSRNIYRKIPVLVPPVPLGYSMTLTSKNGVLYDSVHQNMFINILAFHRDSNQYICVNLFLDRDANVLWRREKPGITHAVMSPDGEYIALFTDDKGKDFEGEVEIIRRDGVTVSTIHTGYSGYSDKFSEDSKKIIFTERHKRIRVYDVQTGRLLNVLTFHGFRPLEEVDFSARSNLLVVLRDKESALGGERVVSVYHLDGSAKFPVWEYDMGTFDRMDQDNYASATHVSISHDGKEITAYSNGWLRRFRLDEQGKGRASGE